MTGAARWRLIGLVIALFALASGVAYQVQDWLFGQAGPSVQEPVRGFPLAAQGGAIEVPNRADAWRAQILSRPLFNPDRRPVAEALRTLSGLSRLTGIIHADTRRLAIFAAPSGGRSLVAEEGSRVGAYEVRSITDTTVVVVGPDGMRVIKPMFDVARPTGTVTPLASFPQAPGRAGK